jgi:hypothetical protein
MVEGGGAGGYRTGAGFSVTAGTTYTITVGAGGAWWCPTALTRSWCNGNPSVFSTPLLLTVLVVVEEGVAAEARRLLNW